MRLITPEEYINDLYDGIDFPVDQNRLELIGKLMTDYAKYYHRVQVKNCDLADVGERKPTYNDGLRKELETLKEKRDAALSSSAIRYWEREIKQVKKRLYG